MLTGDTNPSHGDAIIDGHSVVGKMRRAQQSIGYCPQFDGLSGALTGREHLVLFSKLRGIPSTKLKETVDQTLAMLELTQHANKPVSTYSGGNCRRLSTAIALLANPPVVLLVSFILTQLTYSLTYHSLSLIRSFTLSCSLLPLLFLFFQDEPTSGVDPRARQFLWKIVHDIVKGGQTVVLTTHSMAECEALCSRVGIMVNGTLRCLGSPQQLKHKYGEGYRLKIRTALNNHMKTKEFLSENFPGATLKVS